MKKLIFATNNPHKIEEVRSVLGDAFELVTLQEAGIHTDIPEPFDTLEENALQKSMTIHKMTGQNCVSEDTGLETDALHGEPGVRSARYAGDAAAPEANMQKLLARLGASKNRKARFRTVISLILEGKEYSFTGICEGSIALEASGSKGFGYDPIFIPDGAGLTFAEMDRNEKNRFSHRKKAMDKLIDFLMEKV